MSIDLASAGKVVTVVANDTDILVLLIFHLKPSMADVFLLSSPTGKSRKRKLVRIRDIQQHIGDVAVQQLPVLHAISGCDTTSALYGHGNISAYKKIVSKSDSAEPIDIMNSDCVTQDDVAKAGSKLLVMLYNGKVNDKLDSLRHSAYMSMCLTGTSRPTQKDYCQLNELHINIV